jgi:hypothetical protein
MILELAILFLALAIIVALLCAAGVAGFSWNMGKWLIIIFVVLAVLAFIF